MIDNRKWTTLKLTPLSWWSRFPCRIDWFLHAWVDPKNSIFERNICVKVASQPIPNAIYSIGKTYIGKQKKNKKKPGILSMLFIHKVCRGRERETGVVRPHKLSLELGAWAHGKWNKRKALLLRSVFTGKRFSVTSSVHLIGCHLRARNHYTRRNLSVVRRAQKSVR